MKLIGLVESENHVCCRYRLSAFRPMLAQAGHSLELVSIPSHPIARLRLFCSLTRYDAVVVQRKLLGRLSVSLLRRYAHRLIFDLDDAIWLRDSYHPKGIDSRKKLRRFESICRASDLVIAGNDHLARFANRFATDRVETIPTCVDPSRYPLALHRSETPSLVWVGSASTLQGLGQIRETLDAVGRAVPGLRLKLICDKPLALNSLPVDFVPWNEATETSEIAASDVGIAWMPDDEWSRGKCGLKVLQYLAAGVPVIANRVGVHTTMIRNGQNGYLADSPQEWIEAVQSLLVDLERRRKMGLAGRAFVDFEYSTTEGSRRWNAALELLSSASHRRAG
ncbi:MAG: glycosyltransferase family 4 protein [Gemmataceae bacterium]